MTSIYYYAFAGINEFSSHGTKLACYTLAGDRPSFLTQLKAWGDWDRNRFVYTEVPESCAIRLVRGEEALSDLHAGKSVKINLPITNKPSKG